jgi:hypothetical protein
MAVCDTFLVNFLFFIFYFKSFHSHLLLEYECYKIFRRAFAKHLTDPEMIYGSYLD